MARELAVISGKGGTGKTSVVASFAALAKNAVLADCDVDAADLHLLLEPTMRQRGEFSGGSRARITAADCVGCGTCEELCRFDAISHDVSTNGGNNTTFRVDPIACEGCGVCAHFCEAKAIEFAPVVNGEWFVSDTRCGPMVHARLGVAAENSGKLVSLVRTKARTLAEQRKLDLVLIDGPPGIGCPVIASIAGANLVLVVTEPTLSGLHDLERVTNLTRHFGVETLVCINKWDLNIELSREIETRARQRGVELAGNIRYDSAVTGAQIDQRALVEFTEQGSAVDVKQVWTEVSGAIGRLTLSLTVASS